MFMTKTNIWDKNYKIPSDANTALSHAIEVVVALQGVVSRETDALKECRTKSFLELQDEKVSIAERYETLINDLMARGSALKKADPKLKERLRVLQENFHTVTSENLKWLDRMKRATGKLGDTIMREARRSAEKQTQFAYGASGTMQKGNKALIGFDERA